MQPRLWKVPVISRNSILNTPAKPVYLIERGAFPDDAIKKVKQTCKKLLPDGTQFDLDLYDPGYNDDGRDVQLWNVQEEMNRFRRRKGIWRRKKDAKYKAKTEKSGKSAE